MQTTMKLIRNVQNKMRKFSMNKESKNRKHKRKKGEKERRKISLK
jgi:hypothetical protein